MDPEFRAKQLKKLLKKQANSQIPPNIHPHTRISNKSTSSSNPPGHVATTDLSPSSNHLHVTGTAHPPRSIEVDDVPDRRAMKKKRAWTFGNMAAKTDFFVHETCAHKNI